MDQRDDWHLTDLLLHESGRGDPFAAAIRGTRMPMVITDPRRPDNPIVFANKAFQDLTGYSRDEIVGHNCRFLQGPQTDMSVCASIGKAIRAGETCAVDVLNYRKDGSTFWNALFMSPVRSDVGEIQFFFGSQLDVTDRVNSHRDVLAQKARVEEEIEKRTADLRAAIEAKSALLTELDHRVKNNLTIIGSLLRLQSRRISDAGLRSALEEMLVRVDALGVVHRHLFSSGNLDAFDLAAFAGDLFAEAPYAQSASNQFDVGPAELFIPAAGASAAGLLISEILFQAKRLGSGVRASLQAEGDVAVFRVAAGGADLRATVIRQSEMAGELVERLAHQVRARLVWAGEDTLTITLPLRKGEA